MCDVNEKGLQKKFIVPLVVSELAPAESSEPEVARERVALAGVARREVELGLVEGGLRLCQHIVGLPFCLAGLRLW